MLRTLAVHFACATALLGSFAAASATEPSSGQPIRIVVPYPPGATTDLMARLVGDRLRVSLNETVVVENRPGASGNIGADFVAKSRPDGRTFLMATDATHASNYHLFEKPPFHPITDSTPITLAAQNVIVLVTKPSLPVNTVQELIDYAKANPGKLSFGSSGVGSPHHLAGELFNKLAGTDMMHIAYKGGAPAIADLMGGHVAVVFSSVVESSSYIADGRLKALGVTQSSRYPNMPNVPTIGETLKGFDVPSWLAFVGPAGIPDDAVRKLNKEITTALKSPEIRERLESVGLMVVADSPEAFAKQQKADFELRRQLVESVGIKRQ